MRISSSHIALGLLFGGVVLRPALAQDKTGAVHEIGRTTEKEVAVVFTSTIGSVSISRGEPEKVLVSDSYTEKEEGSGPQVHYVIRNRVGYLDITCGEDRHTTDPKRRSFDFGAIGSSKQHLRFSSVIPISFNLNIGVGKADLDLTGLQVKDLNLSAGASDVVLSFNELNRATINDITIESGVSKFTGRNLGNANFKRLKFQGGVGSFSLDFGGRLKHEVDVDIELGLGVLTLVIPTDVGARIFFDKNFLSRMSVDRDFRSVGSDEYMTDNFYSADGRMNIRIENGLGNVRVRRK